VTQLVGNGLVVASALLCIAFVVTYHWRTGGTWRRWGAWRASEAGRHFMVSMAVFAAVLTLTAVRVIAGAELDTPWFQRLRTAVFAGVPVVFAWRLWLLIRAQRANNEKEHDSRWVRKE
jgi:uncharacterized membrane protein